MNDNRLQLEIDRLVEGELSKQESRDLIARFEQTPGAWKLCALSFLETQSWQRVCGDWRSDTINAGEPQPPRKMIATTSRSRWGLFAAIIASLLVGALGATLWFLANTDEPRERVAGSRPDQTPIPVKAGNPEPGVELLGVVTVNDNGAPEAAYQLVGADDRHFVLTTTAPASPSEYDIRVWERKGYRVEQHRKVVNVELANGRRFQFPVDWRQYRYVGEPVF